jgi:hypothetical protein
VRLIISVIQINSGFEESQRNLQVPPTNTWLAYSRKIGKWQGQALQIELDLAGNVDGESASGASMLPVEGHLR